MLQKSDEIDKMNGAYEEAIRSAPTFIDIYKVAAYLYAKRKIGLGQFIIMIWHYNTLRKLVIGLIYSIFTLHIWFPKVLILIRLSVS